MVVDKLEHRFAVFVVAFHFEGHVFHIRLARNAQHQLAVFGIHAGTLQFAVVDFGKISEAAFGGVPHHQAFNHVGTEVFQLAVFVDDNGVNLFGTAVLVEILHHGAAVGSTAEQHAVVAAFHRAVGSVAVGIIVGDDVFLRFALAHGGSGLLGAGGKLVGTGGESIAAAGGGAGAKQGR